MHHPLNYDLPQVADIVGDILSYCVQDLLEGHEYFFRVYAFNVFGSSEPLETAEAVVVTRPFGASVTDDRGSLD